MGGYGPVGGKSNIQQQDDAIQTFKILKHPHDLDKLEIVWNIALQCQNPQVVPKAIDFLIRVYYSLDNDLDSQRIHVQDDFISKCMTILKDAEDDSVKTRII